MTIETTAADKIETKTCSRCGGSGNYSYCQRYGTTCFGCGGSGVQMTKRGAAASAYLAELRSKPAAELVVGDLIQVGCITMSGDPYNAWGRVESIGREASTGASLVNGVMTPHNFEYVVVTCKLCKGGRDHVSHLCETTRVRIHHAGEAAASTWAAAMAYQASLTNQGKPRKR